MLRRPGLRVRPWLLAVLVSFAIVLQGWIPLVAASLPSPHAPRPGRVERVIPLEEQPFYGELQRIAASWSDVVLDQVVGDSPRVTLLNFYAVMAEVGRRSDVLMRQQRLDVSVGSDADRAEQIQDTEDLFQLAIRALDVSQFPQSIRQNMAEESAIQLKHVLDYVFTHSRQPIMIPDAAGMMEINKQRSHPVETWRIPGTSIALTSQIKSDPEQDDFLFSPETLSAIGGMYREISHYPVVPQPFATPTFFQSFSHTPGHLVPPPWYLGFTAPVRRLLETPMWSQSLFQVCSAVVLLGVYLLVLGWLIHLLLESYRDQLDAGERQSLGRAVWNLDALAWRRFIVLAPILPLTRIVKTVVDDVVNLTGSPLVVSVYFFSIIWHVAAGLFFFFLFEALGRSGSEILARMGGVRAGSSALRLQRITNFMMPLCRAIGVLVAVTLIYRLLIVLGLPSSTVLAFSAVPGLAIGLGASKLLGNLFAGLSIQTDRPLRVGEFCRVGDNLGYITKIGLRSLELETLESRVTIPNSVADEATIINYSRRGRSSDRLPMQTLDVRLELDGDFSPYQLEELLHQSRRFLAGVHQLQNPLVSLERQGAQSGLVLIVFAMVELHGWQAYLALREQLLMHLGELVERAQLSAINLGLSYGTTPEQLQRFPDLMKQAVARDSALDFQACRLERIGAFSYDHVLEFRSNHTTHEAFEDSLHALNRRIIEILAQHQIEIPFPTQTLMLSPSDAAHP